MAHARTHTYTHARMHCTYTQGLMADLEKVRGAVTRFQVYLTTGLYHPFPGIPGFTRFQVYSYMGAGLDFIVLGQCFGPLTQ